MTTSIHVPPLRRWLATALLNPAPPLPEDAALQQLPALAAHEGVTALLVERLRADGTDEHLPAAVWRALTAGARQQAVLALYQRNRCQQILNHLTAAAVPTLVLKGMAVGQWAWPRPELRQCGDIDLLFPDRAAADAAAAVLADLDYARPSSLPPGDLVAFEMTCRSTSGPASGLEIDLHWQLSSTPIFAFRLVWGELDSAAIALPGLAPHARGLAAVHAWLHAAMHRMQNRSAGAVDSMRWLLDLLFMARHFDDRQWRQLADLAIARGLAGTCLDAAAAAAGTFHDPLPSSIRIRLAAAAANEALDIARIDRWWYLQRQNMVAHASPGDKLRWLCQRLLPTRAALQERYGEDAGLARLLARRGLAACKRLPLAQRFMAWRR